MNWYISNNSFFEEKPSLINFFTNIEPQKITESVSIFLDGYIVPRLSLSNDYKHLNYIEFIEELYQVHKLDLINYIKGTFTLIIFIEDKIYIFNDRHSLKKFFIYKNGNDFFISNSLKVISEKFTLTPSNENIAIYCLLEHFVDGMTLFEEVTYSKPASKLIVDEMGSLTFENYWLPAELLNKEIKDYSFEAIAQNWLDIIKGYLDYLDPEEVTMTLTGGNDSRMVLAGLLANDLKPNAFTFGNPESSDGVVAKEIADKVSLNYNNYFVDKPTSVWFKNYSSKILQFGNSLINVHRAHRLDAIEKEINTNPSSQMIFGGFMGGDYTKGIIYDDYITAKLMRLWKYSSKVDVEIVKDILLEAHFNIEILELDNIMNRLRKLPYLDKESKTIEREFLYVFLVVGATHDWQDTNIFSTEINYVVNPFMDIDFLELLFSSKYSMLQKNNSEDNFIKKINYPALAVNTSHLLAPELSSIKYAKKAFYTNEEFLGNKISYISKRIFRYRSRKKYPQNFPYSDWISKYIEKILFSEDLDLNKFFNLTELKNEFDESVHQTTEDYWHKFTNPINIGLNLKEFLK